MEDPTDYDPTPNGGKGRNGQPVDLGAVLRSSPTNNDLDSPAALGLDLQPYERPAKPDDFASDRKQSEYVALTAFEQAAEKAGGRNVEFFTLRDNARIDGVSKDRDLRSVFVKFVREFEQTFGKTVVFFESGESKPGALSYDVTPNFIGININSPFSLSMLLGHELGHAIKRQDRKLYDAFQRDVLALVKGKEAYDEMIKKRGYAADKIDDEMFNDIIGNLFARDSQMWQEMAANDTTGTLAKIATIAANVINKMLNGLRKLNQRDTTSLIEDELLAVRKNIAEMLKLYRQRGNSSREIVFAENAAPDTSPVFLKGDDMFLRSSPTPSDSILRISPTVPTQTQLSEALAKMPAVYREVYQAVTTGTSVADVAKARGLSMKAVENIMRRTMSFVSSVAGAAVNDGPSMQGNMIAGGRPDLALSTIPAVAAVDQMRNELDVPDVRGHDVVNAQAEAMLPAD